MKVGYALLGLAIVVLIGVVVWYFFFRGNNNNSTVTLSRDAAISNIQELTAPFVYASTDGIWIVTDTIGSRQTTPYGAFVTMNNLGFSYLDACRGVVQMDSASSSDNATLTLTCPGLHSPLVLTGTLNKETGGQFSNETRVMVFRRPLYPRIGVPTRYCPLDGQRYLGTVCTKTGYDFGSSVNTSQNSIGFNGLSKTQCEMACANNLDAGSNCSSGACSCGTARWTTTDGQIGNCQWVPQTLAASEIAANPNSSLITKTIPQEPTTEAFLVTKEYMDATTAVTAQLHPVAPWGVCDEFTVCSAGYACRNSGNNAYRCLTESDCHWAEGQDHTTSPNNCAARSS